MKFASVGRGTFHIVGRRLTGRHAAAAMAGTHATAGEAADAVTAGTHAAAGATAVTAGTHAAAATAATRHACGGVFEQAHEGQGSAPVRFS